MEAKLRARFMLEFLVNITGMYQKGIQAIDNIRQNGLIAH